MRQSLTFDSHYFCFRTHGAPMITAKFVMVPTQQSTRSPRGIFTWEELWEVHNIVEERAEKLPSLRQSTERGRRACVEWVPRLGILLVNVRYFPSESQKYYDQSFLIIQVLLTFLVINCYFTFLVYAIARP